jgi:hypothetical protein
MVRKAPPGMRWRGLVVRVNRASPAACQALLQTICAQYITRCAPAADNEGGAGDMGTPELTSPRLQPVPGRFAFPL